MLTTFKVPQILLRIFFILSIVPKLDVGSKKRTIHKATSFFFVSSRLATELQPLNPLERQTCCVKNTTFFLHLREEVAS